MMKTTIASAIVGKRKKREKDDDNEKRNEGNEQQFWSNGDMIQRVLKVLFLSWKVDGNKSVWKLRGVNKEIKKMVDTYVLDKMSTNPLKWFCNEVERRKFVPRCKNTVKFDLINEGDGFVGVYQCVHCGLVHVQREMWSFGYEMKHSFVCRFCDDVEFTCVQCLGQKYKHQCPRCVTEHIHKMIFGLSDEDDHANVLICMECQESIEKRRSGDVCDNHISVL